MKKILFLLIICIIKLNAYEYLFFDNYNDSTAYSAKYRWFTDPNGELKVKAQLKNGSDRIITLRYDFLYYIKLGDVHYIDSLEFKDIYSNDLNFLDDLYTQYTNAFLNYLYTKGIFSDNNHIEYNSYELLYNGDGLVVESIVNGKWAGLYDDDEKQFSGKLYDKDGFLLYSNGEKVDYIQKWFDQLTKPFDTTFMGVVNIISFAALSAIICYYVMDALWYIIDLALWAFTGGRRHLNYEYYH